MIVDNIENAKRYFNNESIFAKTLRFLGSTDFTTIDDGKYESDDPDMFYIVQRYATKPFPSGNLEAHHKFIDIQYLVSGEETIGYSHIDLLENIIPYKPEHDVAIYRLAQTISRIVLQPKQFCLFFPWDAHLPSQFTEKSSPVLKVVAKINALTTF